MGTVIHFDVTWFFSCLGGHDSRWFTFLLQAEVIAASWLCPNLCVLICLQFILLQFCK